jgi:aldehyde dehydrogenase (NAD+)
VTIAPSTHGSLKIAFKTRYGNFIGGQWVAPVKGEYFENITPVTGQPICQIPRSTAEDIELALDAAHAAKAAWGKTSGTERAIILNRIADRMESNLSMLAHAETWDNGKPIRETMAADLPLAIDHFRYFAGCIRAQEGSLSQLDDDTVAYHYHEPLGVVGQIIPWNFPLLMAAWKLAPALAAGNTCVLKPAETTPLTALLLGEILQQAELPPGVVSIITGDGTTGSALVDHPGVDKIAFTGSTEVGRLIQERVASSHQHLTLELGGKGANIVFEDAPVDEMIEGIIDGIFFNQGHVCCAGSRLLVQESIADDVLRRLIRRVDQLRVGDPLDKNTDVGAINSAAQLARINELTAYGEQEGATRYTSTCALPDKGYWFAPTVFADVAQSHRIAREEIFGPVLSVLTFRTPEEAVAKANNTNYGLACGVWSEKGSRTLWVAQRLRAGVIWANTYNRFDPTSPFGGVRESGFGREGGRHGLEAYLDVR